ncbi:MAG: CvpA family protein [Terrimicrobiaceae bacterium]
MPLEPAICLIVLVPVLLRAWQGWRYGATREIRHCLIYLFGMLVAVRYWYPVTAALVHWFHRDPRLSAAAAFATLFFLAAELAALAVNFRAEYVQSVRANPINDCLGAILGVFSGALIGCSLLLVVSLESPALMPGFDRQKLPLPLDRLPLDVFRMVEQNVAGVPLQGPAHTPLPSLPATTPPNFVWD